MYYLLLIQKCQVFVIYRVTCDLVPGVKRGVVLLLYPGMLYIGVVLAENSAGTHSSGVDVECALYAVAVHYFHYLKIVKRSVVYAEGYYFFSHTAVPLPYLYLNYTVYNN